MQKRAHGRRAVVALGGNAITRPGDRGTVEEDFRNLEQSLTGIVDLYERGYEIILTHGNGPQVGNQMIRVEVARDEAPDLPLDVMVADIQGGLGYMIERVLRSKFRRRGLIPRVSCLLSMVEVDANDPAFSNPTKYVGPFYTSDEVEDLRNHRGWDVKEDPGRGWRRVVPSPDPIGIVQWQEILHMLEAGSIVISAGGGGIPVSRSENGELVGIEAVIDKDLASAVLGLSTGASELFLLTGVERVMLNFGKPQQTGLSIISTQEARRHLEEGHFPPGSMGPKIEAACRFIEAGGGRVLVTHIDTLIPALDGTTGTWITA
jgi:carbamate kinase